LAFSGHLEHIPAKIAYLRSSSELRDFWLKRIGHRTRLRVGLAWSGNAQYKDDHKRSMELSRLLASLPADFEYFCLQKHIRDRDQEDLRRSAVSHYGDALTFPHTAALMDLMDVVVTTDTSIAHLAGALGRPTWVMLPLVPDWRWALKRSDSPWYPTLRLYRQDESRSWKPVLAKVAEDLQALSMEIRRASCASSIGVQN
jgi:hypothetical protein